MCEHVSIHVHVFPGTLITEWDDGKKRCDAVLTGEETFKAFADQLVKISNYYGFDGWLVNIENPVEVSELTDQHLHNLRKIFAVCFVAVYYENMPTWVFKYIKKNFTTKN